MKTEDVQAVMEAAQVYLGKSEDVQIGQVYLTKFSGLWYPVKIEEPGMFGLSVVGWYGTNLLTGEKVYITPEQFRPRESCKKKTRLAAWK